MVIEVVDKTGRFQKRPHYKPAELDHECEQIITGFLKHLYGEVKYPIDTEDIKKLIERDAYYLDVYADLSDYGYDVEGVTEFYPGRKPTVKISAHLTEDDYKENRLRTTLTHEYGHVHFHSYLWEFYPPVDMCEIVCKRDNILDSSETDWMEWQAGYVCGAILMPKTAVSAICRPFIEKHGENGVVVSHTDEGYKLIEKIADIFSVSKEAAHIRMLKLKFML